MTALVAPPLTLPELERIVREADRSAFLVAPRILRRVIKADRGLTFLGWHGAHRESYAITGSALSAVVDEAELGIPPGSAWPDTVLLLAQPDGDALADAPRAAVLARYWRLLFHASVHAALDQRVRDGSLDERALRQRIERIGPLAFAEARTVLRQDGRLLPPRNDVGAYCEFVATFLELRHFAPWLLRHEFPAIDDPATVEAALDTDVDGRALLAATRLAGAPATKPPVAAEEVVADPVEPDDDSDDEPPVDAYRRRAQRAEAAARRGNFARAAIVWTQAAQRGGPALARRAQTAARAEIDRLVRRLQPALGFDDAELDRWKRALPALLDRSARGFWLAEARLLYDLQKVANDHEQEVFTVDAVEWIRSRGRRPLRRPLPQLRGVMVSNHVHRAARRLAAAHLPQPARERLSVLFAAAIARIEDGLRSRYRPVIEMTLAENDVRPRNLPERVAYNKLIDELLDRIIDRGFITLGSLRDAFSRSHLKFPDVSGPTEFLRGDRLLRTDSALAEALDGVYRRGEIYLRGLQRISALAFGTRVGRFFTLFVVLPYGGTFVALKGLAHLLELLGLEVELANPALIVPLGTLALALINSRSFRIGFWSELGRGARVLIDGAGTVWRWLSRQPWVRAVVQSPLFRSAWRYVLKPLALSLSVCALGALSGFPWRRMAEAEGGLFVVASILLNSRLGRDAEEIAVESAARLWKRFWLELLPGLFRWVLMIFQQFLEGVERVLYAVDEWLRFRSGQRRGALVVRAALGFVWFFIAYLVRFYVNLLIEPQVNPIKHFPVVTVSHKIILPLSKTITFLIATPLMPLGPVVAYFIAGATVLLLPGIFGFLVWEMKENWRLYEANRPETLRPVVVGDHGETMTRLLRPGFHSGTVPKLFARLRRAERRLLDGERDHRAPRRAEALHHAEHEVARFIDRDFLGYLRESRQWAAFAPAVHKIELTTNRVRVTFRVSDEDDNLMLAFEEDSGTLAATLPDVGWLSRLPQSRQRSCVLALVGLCKMSGVEVLRPPLDAVLAPAGMALGAAPGSSFATGVLSWRGWVEAWESDSETRVDGSQRAASAYIEGSASSDNGRSALEDSEPAFRS